MLEDVSIVFVDRELRARLLLRLEVLPNAELSVGIDAPGEVDPEFVLFPPLARIHFACVGNLLTEALLRRAEDGLPEAEPLRIVRLIRMKVVPFRTDADRQHVVGEVGGFARGG